MKYRNWANRKIKNGKVKIFGNYFKPNEQYNKYNNELENTKQTFYIYWLGLEITGLYMIEEFNEKSGNLLYQDWQFWENVK